MSLEKLLAIIYDLVRIKFYGELVIKFESGRIVVVRKLENIKS